MNFMTLSVAGAMLLSSIAGAEAAKVEFRGAFLVVTATAQCLIGANTIHWLRYNPPNLGDNGSPTRLTILIEEQGAENYTLSSGTLVGMIFRPVTMTVIIRGGFQAPAQMRITTQSPANLATANFVNFAGNIKDFDTPGCNISFKASGVRRET